MSVSRAHIYIDGFNLYYGALKSTPYKWLNLAEMCRLLLPRYHIGEIKYLTGYKGNYDIAVLITNDSDLCEAVRIVRTDLRLEVGVFNPHRKNPSVVLQRSSTFFRPLRTGVLAASQFPITMSDASGAFHKPTTW